MFLSIAVGTYVFGEVKIGMSIDQVRGELGTPTASMSIGGEVRNVYADGTRVSFINGNARRVEAPKIGKVEYNVVSGSKEDLAPKTRSQKSKLSKSWIDWY